MCFADDIFPCAFSSTLTCLESKFPTWARGWGRVLGRVWGNPRMREGGDSCGWGTRCWGQGLGALWEAFGVGPWCWEACWGLVGELAAPGSRLPHRMSPQVVYQGRLWRPLTQAGSSACSGEALSWME